MISVTVPVATVSELNRRDHWAEKHRRAKQQRELTTLLLRTAKVDKSLLRPPFVVKMTRVAPGSIKDSDNLASSTKAIRDAIASFLGIDDADVMGNGSVRWVVGQEKGPTYALRIEIECGTCAVA